MGSEENSGLSPIIPLGTTPLFFDLTLYHSDLINCSKRYLVLAPQQFQKFQ